MVIVVGCWRAVQDGADECSCAAVEDVLQDVGRWFAVLIWLRRWGLRVAEWGGYCWCWLLDGVGGGWAMMVGGIADGVSTRGDGGEVHLDGGLGS